MRDSDTTDNGRYKIMNTMTYDSSLILFYANGSLLGERFCLPLFCALIGWHSSIVVSIDFQRTISRSWDSRLDSRLRRASALRSKSFAKKGGVE